MPSPSGAYPPHRSACAGLESTREGYVARMPAQPRPGRPFPQGAHWDGRGTNFSLWSERAERVELCLFDDGGAERRIDVSDQTAFQWHVYLPEVGPRQRYGYRVHGPYEPAQG